MLTNRVRIEELTGEHVRQAVPEDRAIIIVEDGGSLWNQVPVTGASLLDSHPESPVRHLKRPFEIYIAKSTPSEFERRFQEVAALVDRIKRVKYWPVLAVHSGPSHQSG